MADKYKTQWANSLNRFLGTQPLVIIDGNVHDLFFEGGRHMTVTMFIQEIAGAGHIACRITDGFHCAENKDQKFVEETTERIRSEIKSNEKNKVVRGGLFDETSEVIKELLLKSAEELFAGKASSIVIQLSLLDMLGETQGSSVVFAHLRDGILNAFSDVDNNGHEKINTLVIVIDDIHSLPAWFVSNEAKIITIGKPDTRARREYLEHNYKGTLNEDDLNALVTGTEGMTIRELASFMRYHESLERTGNITDSLDSYRYGVTDNRWKTLAMNADFSIEKVLKDKIKGQDYVLEKISSKINSVLKGRNSVRSTANHRPKAVFFLSGPTGVGKTETARTLAETIFGSKEALITIRFNEYTDKSAINNLIGSPKGYVGNETGGELTNAVRNNPFSVVLFDEIEKADDKIFNVLQSILEEGKITDGMGNTVDFSQTIILFTSNIGLEKTNTELLPTADMTPETAESKYTQLRDVIMEAMGDRFRPEFINKIGGLDSVLVYSYIYGDYAKQIIEQKVKNLETIYSKDGINITVEDDVKEKLLEDFHLDHNIVYGGRHLTDMVDKLAVDIDTYLDKVDIGTDNIIEITCQKLGF